MRCPERGPLSATLRLDVQYMDPRSSRLLGLVTALLLNAVLAGCASVPSRGERTVADPLEPMNRVVFDVNMALDSAFIKPLAEAYRAILPPLVRDRIRSAIDNLAEPRIFANDVLQRRMEAAGITLARFVINTTVGLAGFF